MEKESKISTQTWKLVASFGSGVLATLLIVFAFGGNTGLFKGQLYFPQTTSNSSATCNQCSKLDEILKRLNGYTASFNNFTEGMGNFTADMNKFTKDMNKFTKGLEKLPEAVNQILIRPANNTTNPNTGLRILR